MGWIIKGFLDVDSLAVPFYARSEDRADIRYSVGKNRVNIKLPKHYTKKMINKELKKVEKWLSKAFLRNKALRSKFELKEYQFRNAITLLGDEYRIEVNISTAAVNKITLIDDVIHVEHEDGFLNYQIHDVFQRLLSRFVVVTYTERMTNLVLEINDKYFHKEISSVKLKYNKSNWGSCSTIKNINLSTRLLLCPDMDVVKYVIVHELAHLKEMNHSPAFWKIVEDVMPDYKIHERWLKQYGHTLDF